MRRTAALLRALALTVICGLALPVTAQQARPVIVGVALPQTGMLSDLGAGMRDALLLWQEQVNARGGLAGRRVELRIHDDASEAVRARSLYELLIKDDQADILVGPFGSAASSMAAAVADRARRVMVNASGTSPAIHKRAYRWVFQVPPPSDAYAAGLLPLALRAGARSLSIVASEEPAGTAMRDALKTAAEKQGLALSEVRVFEQGNVVDLAAFAAELRKAGTEVLLSPASLPETGNLLRGLRAAGFMPRIFATRAITDPGLIASVGVDAEHTMGFSSWEANARTVGNPEFVSAYRTRYKRAPDFHAACGWAAGTLIEAAVARAGGLDQAALRIALSTMDADTVLGPYKVDADGAQVGAQSLIVQIQKGRREVVWPDALASAAPVLPAPGWNARALPGRK